MELNKVYSQSLETPTETYYPFDQLTGVKLKDYFDKITLLMRTDRECFTPFLHINEPITRILKLK